MNNGTIYSAVDVARHIINHADDTENSINNLQLQKLLYFAQAYYLMEKDRVLFRDQMLAWEIGPVIPSVYEEFRQYGGASIPRIRWSYPALDREDEDVERIPYRDRISKNDAAVIDGITDNLIQLPAHVLTAISQRQDPWMKAYSPDDDNEITPESIREFFRSKPVTQKKE